MSKKLFTAEAIEKELAIFEEKYSRSISSDNPRIQNIITHMMKSSGKKIRPILLLLAAKYNGDINEVTYNSAITVELLHTASLIHDDVVDESMLRRGRPSCNAIFDNKSAVLAGDYYLSTSLVSSVLTHNFEIIAIISELGRTLAEGELNQLALVKELIVDESEYFDVIRKKTASLISSCMRVGAISTNASKDLVNLFTELGDNLGMIFQLRDDIFDYFNHEIGKPTGNDIREGKITLPLLYSLKNSNDTTKVSKAYDIIKNFNFTNEHVDFLLQFAVENGGVEYAYSQMEIFKNNALVLLNQLADGDVKVSLLRLLDYLIHRNY